MARDNFAITGATQAGIVGVLGTPVAANNGEFDNAVGRTVLIFINGLGAASGGATVITTISVADPYGRTGDIVNASCAADTVFCAGPYPPFLFNVIATGRVQVDFDLTDANARVVALHVPG